MKPVPEPDLEEEDELMIVDDEDFGAPMARQVPPTAKFQRPSNPLPSASSRKPTHPSHSSQSSPSELLSFDDFLQTLSPTLPPKPSPPPIISQKPVFQSPFTPKSAVVVPRKNELKKAKEQALAREAALQSRKKAAERIQSWWRRLHLRRRLQNHLRVHSLYLHFHRFYASIFTRELVIGMKLAFEREKELRALIVERYRETCAIAIQRKWRSYMEKRREKEEMEREKVREMVENGRKEVLRAWVKGWKTRKVLQSWPLQDILTRLQSSFLPDRPFLLLEFHQTFKSEYSSGKWMRQRVLESRSRRVKPRKPTLSSALSHSPNRVADSSLRLHSPSVSMETVSSTPKTQWTSRPVPDLPKFVAKPFLKRKTQKIAMQKVNWTGVKTKVKCWEEVKNAKNSKLERNSLEEFMEMERQSIKVAVKNRRNRQESPVKVPQRSSSQPQTIILRGFKKGKGEGDFGRLNTIKSLEEGDDSEKMFATYDSGLKQVRLKRKQLS